MTYVSTMLTSILFVALLIDSNIASHDMSLQDGSTPESARDFCRELATGYSLQNGGSKFVDMVLGEVPAVAEEMVQQIEHSENRLQLIEILISLGSADLVDRLWPAIKKTFRESKEYDWEWSPVAIAVMCSNRDTASYLLETRGYDANLQREGVADLMLMTIVQRDLKLAEIVFSHGYDRCNRKTGRGESLVELADRLDLERYDELYEKYCGLNQR